MSNGHLLTCAVVVSTLVACAKGTAVAADPPGAGEPAVSIERIQAHVKYLASDRLEGRGVGTRGEELAIDYLAREFEKAGLKPAGERGTFFQTVPLLRVTTDTTATLAAAKGDQAVAFRPEEEFAGQSHTQQPVEDFDAEAVFLGHGIVAPEFGWDDYQGVDVKGKVVVLFTNEPPSDDPNFFNGKALTYYGRWTFKFEEATRRGAKAVLIIHTNETAGYPYSVVQSLEGVQIRKAPDTPGLAFAGWLSRPAGEKLLALAGRTVEGSLQEADKRGFKAVPLGIRIKGHIPTKTRPVATKNVIGLVEGSDPALKAEAVIFTAHWDHLGLGKATLGDNIYNGAADNATGCALLLEIARLWAAQKPRPKRSALFLATTAEESGLLGAAYYAQHPVVPLGKTALNLNFDTVHPLGVPESVVVNGAERTTAWPVVQNVARTLQLDLEPDSRAHLGLFYRSDHFALARGGVPAFSVSPGARIKGKPAGYFKKAAEEYTAKAYHTPLDEYRADWDFSGFAVLIRFASTIGREVANGGELPTWAPGDEFRPARDRSQVK
jgi:Zn-dependent M28 family amino/carboxypeptidase